MRRWGCIRVLDEAFAAKSGIFEIRDQAGRGCGGISWTGEATAMELRFGKLGSEKYEPIRRDLEIST